VITAQEAAARAGQLRDLGRLDDAERVLRSALSQDPSDGELLLMLAAVLLSARRFDEGLAASAGALAAAPDDERGHRIRALLLSGQGRYREAVESGYRAVTLPRSRRPRRWRTRSFCSRPAGWPMRPRSPAGRSSWLRSRPTHTSGWPT